MVDGNKLVKHDLHLLLLGNLPHEIIVSKLNTKYRLTPRFTERMVHTYQHFFWNVQNSTYEEWDKILSGKYYKDAFMASLYCGEHQALYRAQNSFG